MLSDVERLYRAFGQGAFALDPFSDETFVADPLSGVIIAVTLPLIPLFMVLIGLVTAERSAAALQRGRSARLSFVRWMKRSARRARAPHIPRLRPCPC